MLNFSKKTKRTVLIFLFGFLLILVPGRFVLPQAPVVGSYFTAFYIYVDGLSLLQKGPWGKKSRNIYYPEGQLDYPKEAIKGHFEERNMRFVLLSEDVRVYTSPTENAEESRLLLAGPRVRVTYTLPNDLWSFVIDPETLAPMGWCRDRVLGYKDRFSPITNWSLPYFAMCIGEYCATFQLTNGGAFEMSWEAVGQGLQLSGTGTGQLYAYHNLVWLKQDNPANLDELMLRTPDGGLKHELRRNKEPITLSKQADKPLRNTKKSVFSF